MNEIDKLRLEELNAIKKYINYDKLVDDIILKKNQVLKAKIEIARLEQNIIYIENDVKRIEDERIQSNNNTDNPNFCHLYTVNPFNIYSSMNQNKEKNYKIRCLIN